MIKQNGDVELSNKTGLLPVRGGYFQGHCSVSFRGSPHIIGGGNLFEGRNNVISFKDSVWVRIKMNDFWFDWIWQNVYLTLSQKGDTSTVASAPYGTFMHGTHGWNLGMWWNGYPWETLTVMSHFWWNILDEKNMETGFSLKVALIYFYNYFR